MADVYFLLILHQIPENNLVEEDKQLQARHRDPSQPMSENSSSSSSSSSPPSPSDHQDYYSILNIPRNASIEEIRNAYKRLCVLYHPDKHLEETSKGVARTIFNKIHTAYTGNLVHYAFITYF